ncbi:MAG: hypothetical protein AB7S36_19375 [Planctomycetota bacterium]
MKRFAMMLLAGLFVAALVGCGGPAADNKKPGKTGDSNKPAMDNKAGDNK